MELPPRTRRILGLSVNTELLGGTTSAYAENTLPTRESAHCAWNYLRVRGEYGVGGGVHCGGGELPPRTRRIQGKQQDQ